jgi:hypothetical protein
MINDKSRISETNGLTDFKIEDGDEEFLGKDEAKYFRSIVAMGKLLEFALPRFAVAGETV